MISFFSRHAVTFLSNNDLTLSLLYICVNNTISFPLSKYIYSKPREKIKINYSRSHIRTTITFLKWINRNNKSWKKSFMVFSHWVTWDAVIWLAEQEKKRACTTMFLVTYQPKISATVFLKICSTKSKTNLKGSLNNMANRFQILVYVYSI